MNKKHLVTSALMAALLAAHASGFAQDRYHGRDQDRRDHDRYSQRDRGDHDRDHDRDERSWQGRNNQRWDGAGPEHAFRRGDHLPPRYRNRQYVVTNYREHRLRPPPRGYQWVQTGSDYVLAAIATGIIADILVNR